MAEEIDIPPKMCCLIGPPGGGKTTMIALTAPEPVHFLDIDRKLPAMMNVRDAIRKGRRITWVELKETFAEETLAARAIALATNKKPASKPKGWLAFSEMVDGLPRSKEAMEAKTWAIDSTTRLGTHLYKLIQFADPEGISTFSPRDWGSFLQMWQETMMQMTDIAKQHGKHLIWTVHERQADIAGPNSKAERKLGPNNQIVRIVTGMQDIKTVASIPGQFGIEMPSYFEEFYGLNVRTSMDGKPRWVCRVKPDGKRDLRTSCNVDFEECEPDFNKIWRFKK